MPSAARGEVLEIPGHDNAGGGLKGDYQQDDIILLRRHPVRPWQWRQLVLDLENRQERSSTDGLDPELRASENVELLELVPVFQRDPETPGEENVNEPAGRTGR